MAGSGRVWQGAAWCGRRGEARWGQVCSGAARQAWLGADGMVGLGTAGEAWQGTVWQRRVWHGRAGPVRLGTVRRGTAGAVWLGMAWPGVV
jgi:hypothetical protein